jgi:2,4-didehydro-3-deoxy-L-rhamnonate hydrolase
MRLLSTRVLFGFAAVLLSSTASLANGDAAPDFTVEIAPPSEALTLARATVNGSPQLIAVMSYKEGIISGVALTGAPDDPITAFQSLGFVGLDALIAEAGAEVATMAADLLMPVTLGSLHIAAGTNFPEHAEEATVEEGPFLFTKAVQPTFGEPLPYSDEWLLDYEVELCFVGFEVIDLESPPEHVGLFLCNDFTDRAALLRHVDPFDIASGEGFTTGKSAPGFMPIGDLFVIPRDRASFVPDIELTLYVNNGERQRAFQRQAIWDFEEILVQIDQRRDVVWDYRGTPIKLPLEDRTIPLRTAILGGTPAGTIFQGDISLSLYVKGILQWLAGGWDKGVVHWVIESVIEDAKESGEFLQPGDVVTLHADMLGRVSTVIIGEDGL